MEILLASTVAAALITSLVNLWLAYINSRNSRELEKFKQELGLEVSEQLEMMRARMRADELATSRLWQLRSYIKTNNISTLVRAMGKLDDDSFTKLCCEDATTLFIEYCRQIEECSVYLKEDRLGRIEASADALREKMRALADAPKPDAKQRANDMLIAFAKYNTMVEEQIDEALGQALESTKR